MKTLQILLLTIMIISGAGIIYAVSGYYTTLKKIEITCHRALAFKDPSPVATAICHSHGFYQ